MNSYWLVNRTNPEFLAYLSRNTSISTIAAQILVNRGIKDTASINDFLTPSLESLHDPFLLPDMDRAVHRIREAVKRNETVLVHGDYDADGITATSLLVMTLTDLGLRAHYHIPHRIHEGYGFSEKGIKAALRCGATLIITVDCGIGSAEEIEKARFSGIDVIITDHHVPPECIPDAVAVINPHRRDSLYPFKYLAGVGVAFKLVQALIYPDMERSLLDLVALGTVADSVPLTGENRILVAQGLKELNRGENRVGIRALQKAANACSALRACHLSFRLIPRINAIGRMADAKNAVELFLTQDRARAEEITCSLEDYNRERQKISNQMLRSAMHMIDTDNPERAIILSSPDWHPGVIGIVASRLVEIFYRPVFLFSVNGATAKGSARGIPPLHLVRSIAECSDLLRDFGGHNAAAGINIATANLPVFKERMNHIVQKALSDEDISPTFEIDSAVKLSDIDSHLLRELDRLEPFGKANEEPLFGSKEVEILEHKVVSNNHLKMRLRQNGTVVDAIGFGMGNIADDVDDSLYVDIAFSAGTNEWNGMRDVQLYIKCIRPTAYNL